MTESEVRSKCTNFSIKNFVADLPRMLNEAFNTICDCIFSFYTADNGDIHLKNIAKLEASYIDATTIVCSLFDRENKKIYVFDEFYKSGC